MWKRRLKSLTEHNAERRARHAQAALARRNGLACPECGAELIDSKPGVTFTSDPPQTAVACPACPFEGMRIA